MVLCRSLTGNPRSAVGKFGWPGFREALAGLHNPKEPATTLMARRLACDELFAAGGALLVTGRSGAWHLHVSVSAPLKPRL